MVMIRMEEGTTGEPLVGVVVVSTGKPLVKMVEE